MKAKSSSPHGQHGIFNGRSLEEGFHFQSSYMPFIVSIEAK